MAVIHTVKAVGKGGQLARKDQLAWKIAEVAARSSEVQLTEKVKDMVINRIIDNAAIALAAINEEAVTVMREKTLASAGTGLASIYGMPGKFGVSQAAYVNAGAVRFRDQDDTYLAAEYSHPDDNISPILAVAQQMGCSGEDVMRGIAVAYEIHVALVGTGSGTGICLHKHKVDHMTHIAAATAAGIGAMLGLSVEEIYHAVNFAVHNAVSSRQSRKGEIGAQKELVPAYSAEIAIEAVNVAMSGNDSGQIGPNPVYEGEDSIIRRFLDGRENPDAEYKVRLPEPGVDTFENILITYPKEHAFEYQGQAIIDAVLEVIPQLPADENGKPDLTKIEKIVLETSHHTHHVIGVDAKDPQKVDPDAPRGTLDHSIMFAVARALQLGRWDEDVYEIAAADKEVLRELMLKVETKFDAEWERKYHSTEPTEQAMGGKLIFTFTDGTAPVEITKERANAHCFGDTPWGRENYIGKLEKLTKGIMSDAVRENFVKAAGGLEAMLSSDLQKLTPVADLISLARPVKPGLYTGAVNAQAHAR
ncbi:MAG TPA: MmgE/PrpD family protein [Alphaproteobacteria bacterium]|nr:2-methylcitrate dehydratase [Rhodospirillaceae bacterium]HRJ12286.1 MmgE/PrpD family protein [Alphaproteobacteria bacterium]